MAQATLALLRNACGASAAMMTATQLQNEDTCVAGAALTTAMLRRCNHSCVADNANNGNATAMQQGRLRCQCRKDNGKAMTTR
jgi:hypothetical protein